MPVISDGFSYVFRTDGNQCSEGVPTIIICVILVGCGHYLTSLRYWGFYMHSSQGDDFWPSVNSKMFISFDMDSTLDLILIAFV
jgi:hypothetical protein